ncbi:carboxypeptidase regulatory-like domain-containing protein [bacterium]|nr:carboxypeptidase regulatory-like domain-containing protein [bacterium]
MMSSFYLSGLFRKWAAKLSIITMLVIAAASVHAQGVTTASFSGMIKDNNGQPVYGANVIAKHEPSGTVFGAASRADGRYNIPAVRVGGPYTIRVEFIGYKAEPVENITVALGQDRRIDFTMVEEAVALEEVAIVAERSSIINESRTGASKTVSNTEIMSLPTISRSFDDFTRLTPQFQGNQAAGRNNRYNTILIDGAVNNDVFGLAASGTPGGQAGTVPISLDAIQEFQIEIAPYDIRKSGFTGGSINAITRGGTNTFHGTFYATTRNEGLVGKAEGQSKIADFSEKWYGFSVGGPIQRDKIFFFVNAEFTDRNAPSAFGITGSGNSNDFGSLTGITVADAENFRNVLMNQYGYDPGSFGVKTLNRTSTRLFGRIDYNISKNHRLTLRHNYVDAGDDNLGRSTGTGSSNGFQFSKAGYEFADVTNSSVLQLNSTLSNTMYNEFRFTYQTIRDKRKTSDPFPFVRVQYGSNLLVAGTENFSQANSLDYDIIELTDDFSYYMGDHTFTVGTHNEIYKFDNVFIRDFYGNYTFANIDSLVRGTPSSYALSYSLDPADPKPSAKFGYQQLGFYVQDVYKVMEHMNVTAGVRFDVPIFPDKPAANDTVANTSFLDGITERTEKVPTGNILISPRLGANWDVHGDGKTQIRGGIGIFSGRTPFVWISNQYGNTGVEFGRTTTNPGVGSFTTDIDNQPGKVFTAPPSEIDLTAKDFKLPQVWRLSLGVDHELPYGIIGTIDFIASKNINQIRYQDINLRPAANTRQLSLSGDPNGLRPVYSTATAGKYKSQYTNVIYLSNTDNGYEYNLTFALQKNFAPGLFGKFDKGYYANVAYTYGRSVDENSGTSSQAISNWRFNPIQGDPNHVGSATSNYETRHRIVGSYSHSFEFVSKYTTTFSFVYVGRSGRPYSETYSGDVNGDGQTSNDLVYVPKDQSDINIVPVNNDPRTATEVWNDLNDYINGDDAMKDARGKIIKRNASTEPWVNRVDFHFAQVVPLDIAKGKFEFTMDLLNLFNFIDKSMGVEKFVNNQDNTNIIYRGVISGQPAFTFGNVSGAGVVTLPKRFQTNDLNSRWQIQFGMRYTF